MCPLSVQETQDKHQDHREGAGPDVELEGEAEKQLQKAFAMKRTHD